METWDVCETITINSDNETCLYREEIEDLPMNWFLCTHPSTFDPQNGHAEPCSRNICPIKKKENEET